MRLHDEGYRYVTAIDTSSVVVDQMSRLTSKTYPEIEYLHMDCTYLDFPEACFDCVIDKALMDTVIANEVDPAPRIKRMIREILKVSFFVDSFC